MAITKTNEHLQSLVEELRQLPAETEWLEFKVNNTKPQEIGEYLSALSNSATYCGKANAYIIWGVSDSNRAVVGTTFKPSEAKVGNEALESWLLRLLSPKIHFYFYEFLLEEKNIVLLEISAAFRHPVQFEGIEYIRIGSYKKKLKDHPEKERELWRIFDRIPFEREIAAENLLAEDVLKLLDYPNYFSLSNLPLPENREGILGAFESEGFTVRQDHGKWIITKLGAILFSKNLADFQTLKRKAMRVILYDGDLRVKTHREYESLKGYASGFEELMQNISHLLPTQEFVGLSLRKNIGEFPPLAIRELVANAMIHQDFYVSGTGPMVEIFSHRVEITNPGLPLVKTERFLDSPPKSRNEHIASFMRRIGVCEERGSGIDKVVSETERCQLPAPIFETTDEHTRAVLFAHRAFKEMDKADRVRACYLHASLRYAQRSFMTNTTLRERFGIEPGNSAMVSRIIKDAIESKLIRCHDESVGSKAKKYLPWWG